MKIYMIIDENGRLGRPEVFTDPETAKFALGCMKMFQSLKDQTNYFVHEVKAFEGSVDEYLAASGLGPRMRKA